MAEGLNIIDYSWSGFAAETLVKPAIIEADTFEQGACHIRGGIRKQLTIPRIDVTDIIQPYAATPTSQGQVPVDGRVLDPAKALAYIEFNPADFEEHFYAENLADMILHRNMPQPALGAFVMQTMARIGEFSEQAVWQSRLAYAPGGSEVQPGTLIGAYWLFDGWIQKLLKDTTTLSVAGAVALTPSNIRTQMQAAYALVPKPLLFKRGGMGLKFLMSYEDVLTYQEALRTDAFKNQNTTEEGINKFDGYIVQPLAGIPTGTFVLTIANPNPLSSRLWIGLNSEEDFKVEVKPVSNPSDLWYIKALFKIDVQHTFGSEVVLYTPLTV